MQYLTFDEYKEMGGMLDLTAFKRNIVRTCSTIENATFGRISKMDDVPIQVKALCRDLVEYLSNNINVQNVITGKSHSSGPVSQSESYLVKSKEEQNQDIDNMLNDYLASVRDGNGTPLLYRGCVI